MRRLGLAAAAALAVACQLPGAGPESAAERFWAAMSAGDVAAARLLATDSSAHLVETLGGEQRIETVSLGETLRNENAAIVRTSLVTEHLDRRLSSAFDTHMVFEAGVWKVDVRATEREWTTAMFAASMRQLGEVLGESLQEFGNAVEEGTTEVMQAIVEALEQVEAERQEAEQP